MLYLYAEIKMSDFILGLQLHHDGLVKLVTAASTEAAVMSHQTKEPVYISERNQFIHQRETSLYIREKPVYTSENMEDKTDLRGESS